MTLHLAKIKNKWICYLEGKNPEAMKLFWNTFLEHYHINYLSSHKLAQIRDVFGLREERYKRKQHKKQRKDEKEKNARLNQF